MTTTPAPGSPEGSAMIDSVLAEYGWPANPKNAARAGYEAARRLAARQDAVMAVLQKDAERYRWLRDTALHELQFDHTDHTCVIGILVPCEWDEDPTLDDAIDAALRAHKEMT